MHLISKLKMKNFTSLSVIIALILSFTLPFYSATAQEITRPTEPEKACEDKKPELLERLDPILGFPALEELGADIDKGEIEFNYAAFEDEFEEVQEQYHKYVECIFEFAEDEILWNIKGDEEIDWMSPQEACFNSGKVSGKLKEIKDNTKSDVMLPPLLEIYNEYSDYLDALVILYEAKGRENAIPDEELSLTAIDQFAEAIKAYTGIDRIVKLEKENALVAMDIAFKSLKELRLAFFMHIHFQCMLNNLEKYRKWLADIRTIVEGFPLMLEDASMVK